MLSLLITVATATAGDVNPDYQAGVQALKAKDNAGAIAAFERCVASEPNNADCHWEAGWAYWNGQDWTQAVNHWEVVKRVDPQRKDLDKYLAQATEKRGPVQPEPVVVAPVAAAEPPPAAEEAPKGKEEKAKEKKAKEPKAPKDPTAPAEPGAMHISAAVHVGATIPFTPLTVGFVPRIEAGVRLPAMDGRLTPLGMLSFTSPDAIITGSDDQLPEGEKWTVTVHQRELMFGAGVNAHIFPEGKEAKVYPEVTLAPQVVLLETIVNGDANSSEFGENREHFTRFGLLFAPGAYYPLGPGAITGQVGLTWARLGGMFSGDVSTVSVDPTVGYRMEF